MVLPLAAVAGAQIGGSVLGGLLGSRSARRAARAQAQAYDDAIRETGRSYDEAQNFLVPRADQEAAAMERVNALLGLGGEAPDYSLFRDTPGYQFQQDEALRATERSAAARGNLLSGNTLASVLERSQGIADSTFQNYLSQVMGLQNQGVDAMRAGMAIDRGTATSNLLLGKGGARASGIVGAGNAWSDALGGVAQGIGTIYGHQQQNALVNRLLGGG